MPKQKQKRVLICFVLFAMLMCQLVLITRFSAQTAQQSSAESRGVLRKIIELVLETEKENINPDVYQSMHNVIRKIAHFAIFFVLGFICTMISNELCSGHVIRVCMAAIICGLITACLDEAHQYFVPGRSAQITDVCVDFSGVIAGNILFTGLKKVFKC